MGRKYNYDRKRPSGGHRAEARRANKLILIYLLVGGGIIGLLIFLIIMK